MGDEKKRGNGNIAGNGSEDPGRSPPNLITSKSSKPRVEIVADKSSIEPLGPMFLGGIAVEEGWEPIYYLVENQDYSEFHDFAKDVKPKIIGFSTYTGNHVPAIEALVKLKKDHPSLLRIAGGYHTTYFADEVIKYVDVAVKSEGNDQFRRILRGDFKKGEIMSPPKFEKEELERLWIKDEWEHPRRRFSFPDRKGFYAAYPEYAKSPIKSMITMTGCPYACSYCFNASFLESLGIGMGNRVFPTNVRPIEDIAREGRWIKENTGAELIYFQDDVHGMNLLFMEKFGERWKEEVSIPYHAQMRFEMLEKDGGTRRLELVKDAGASGLTLAIESADGYIRNEVLNRRMNDEIMFEGMQKLTDFGLTSRTEQMMVLPYGATSNPTDMNLDQDLNLIELNVKLIEETGSPTMSWGSILAPYWGTEMYKYTSKFGHYIGENNDVPASFFYRSTLRQPKEWIGPSLEQRKDDSSVWLSHNEQERYNDQSAELQKIFNIVTRVPEGHKLAKSYLESSEPYSSERLGRETEKFISARADGNPRARNMYKNIQKVRALSEHPSLNVEEREYIRNISGYLGVMPDPELIVNRVVKYGRDRGFSSRNLSNAIRHELYDGSLYNVDVATDRSRETSPLGRSSLKI
jgi:anaerobic magnesium-protoporphyrin IX monomethyl ester cyclase